MTYGVANVEGSAVAEQLASIAREIEKRRSNVDVHHLFARTVLDLVGQRLSESIVADRASHQLRSLAVEFLVHLHLYTLEESRSRVTFSIATPGGPTLAGLLNRIDEACGAETMKLLQRVWAAVVFGQVAYAAGSASDEDFHYLDVVVLDPLLDELRSARAPVGPRRGSKGLAANLQNQGLQGLSKLARVLSDRTPISKEANQAIEKFYRVTRSPAVEVGLKEIEQLNGELDKLIGGEEQETLSDHPAQEQASTTDWQAFSMARVPPQDMRAPKFKVSSANTVELVQATPGGSFSALIATIPPKVEDACRQIRPELPGYNFLAPLLPHLDAYRSAIVADEVVAEVVWSKGNTLRTLLDEVDRRPLDDFDVPLLPIGFAGVFRDLVQTHNAAMASHPMIVPLEKARFGPTEHQATAETMAAGLVAITGVANVPGLMSRDAAAAALSVARQADSEASPPGGFNEARRVTSEMVIANAISAVVEASANEMANLSGTSRLMETTERIAKALEQSNLIRRQQAAKKPNDALTAAKVTAVSLAVTVGIGSLATATLVTFAQPILAFTSQYPALNGVTEAVRFIARHFGVPI